MVMISKKEGRCRLCNAPLRPSKVVLGWDLCGECLEEELKAEREGREAKHTPWPLNEGDLWVPSD